MRHALPEKSQGEPAYGGLDLTLFITPVWCQVSEVCSIAFVARVYNVEFKTTNKTHNYELFNWTVIFES